MGQALGKFDPNATNTVDSQGSTVTTGTQGGKVVADPMGGLSKTQYSIRKGLSNGLSGMGQGLSQQQQQPMGGGATQFQSPQPQLQQLDYQAGLNMAKPFPKGPNSSFYGGY